MQTKNYLFENIPQDYNSISQYQDRILQSIQSNAKHLTKINLPF